MKLVGSTTSPFVRKVRVVMAEKRIDYDFQLANPWSPDTRVPELNPLGKVPVLVMDDGNTLFDSRVITEYLDSISPVARLIPEPNRQRIVVRRWEALADGMCDSAASIFLEKKRSEQQQSADWIARQHKKIETGLRAAARDLGERSWCCGESYNLADVALGCALFYLGFRFQQIDWRSSYPNLERFADKIGKRPSFKDTVPVA